MVSVYYDQLHALCSGRSPILARSIKDIITGSSPEATYSSIKTEALRRNTQSAESRFRILMKKSHIGVRTPFEFLRHLRELSDSSLKDSPVLSLGSNFFYRHPPNIESILAPIVDASSIDQIATMADKVIEFRTPPATKTTSDGSLIASTSQQSSLPTSSELLNKIEALTRHMDPICQDCKLLTILTLSIVLDREIRDPCHTSLTTVGIIPNLEIG